MSDYNWKEPYSDSQLENRYAAIKAYFKNKKVRDFYLTRLLAEFAGKKNGNYDSLYTTSVKTCSNSFFITQLDSVMAKNKNTLITLDDAYNTKIFNSLADSGLVFKNLMNGKPLVIDCWASWCLPCLKERDAFQEFVPTYKGSVDFISLSFDKSKIAWQNKMKTFIV